MTAEQLVTWVVGAIVGVLQVPVFQWLKSKVGIEGKAAFLAVFIFSLLLATAALAATGGFSPFDMNRAFEYAGTIVALSQFVYRLFVAS